MAHKGPSGQKQQLHLLQGSFTGSARAGGLCTWPDAGWTSAHMHLDWTAESPDRDTEDPLPSEPGTPRTAQPK